MSWHSMIISEADPHHTGFLRKYYAMIDVEMSGTDWVWRQVDAHGNYVGNVSGPFSTEDAAKDDALKTLDGDEWE